MADVSKSGILSPYSLPKVIVAIPHEIVADGSSTRRGNGRGSHFIHRALATSVNL